MSIDTFSSHIAKTIRSTTADRPKHSKMFILPINPTLLAETKQIAETNHMSASSFIRQSIMRNIKRYADE